MSSLKLRAKLVLCGGLTSVCPENTGVKNGTRPVTIKTPANSICEPTDDKVMLIGVDAHGISNLVTRSSTMVVTLRLFPRNNVCVMAIW